MLADIFAAPEPPDGTLAEAVIDSETGFCENAETANNAAKTVANKICDENFLKK